MFGDQLYNNITSKCCGQVPITLYDSVLLQVTGISQHRMATASGLNDYDYQKLSTLTRNESIHLNQLETVGKVPIPPEVMEHFKRNFAKYLIDTFLSLYFILLFADIKCHCMMGLFPEIGRAWLTIDSDIYVNIIDLYLQRL